MELVPGGDESGGGGTVYYLVRRAAAVTGRDLRSARPSLDENNRPAVAFTLSSEGADRFGRARAFEGLAHRATGEKPKRLAERARALAASISRFRAGA
jgi:preprotein translocase subunit SecD